MKHLRILILIPLTLLLTGSVTQQHLMVVARKNVAAAPSGPSTEFTDDFNRSDGDSLGADWTESKGDLDIVSNALACKTASYGGDAAWVDTLSLNANGWMKFTFTELSNTNTFAKVYFRVTDGASECYGITVNNTGGVTWSYYTSPGNGESAIVGPASTGTPETHSYGITWTGTGNDVVVRVWYDPTGNEPLGATEWGTSETADVTWTTDPGANNVDTGGSIGFGGAQDSPNFIIFDDVFAGNL